MAGLTALMETREDIQTEESRDLPFIVQVMIHASDEFRIAMFGINIVRLLFVFLEIRFKATGRLLPYI